MCLKQKKGCDERSKLILLSADDRFCVQQLKENASPKKVFAQQHHFLLLLKAPFFLCGRTKSFLLFFCAFCTNDFCSWQILISAFFTFANGSKSKHTLLRNLNVD